MESFPQPQCQVQPTGTPPETDLRNMAWLLPALSRDLDEVRQMLPNQPTTDSQSTWLPKEGQQKRKG